MFNVIYTSYSDISDHHIEIRYIGRFKTIQKAEKEVFKNLLGYCLFPATELNFLNNDNNFLVNYKIKKKYTIDELKEYIDIDEIDNINNIDFNLSELKNYYTKEFIKNNSDFVKRIEYYRINPEDFNRDYLNHIWNFYCNSKLSFYDFLRKYSYHSYCNEITYCDLESLSYMWSVSIFKGSSSEIIL